VLLDGLTAGGWLLALVALVGVWELCAPRGALTVRRSLRWPTSFTLGPLNGLLATMPVAPLALAMTVQAPGWGLATSAWLPGWLSLALCVLLLDLLVYGQHRAFHGIPLLWRVHRVHHSDVDFDYSTAFRFHPLEALLTNATAFAAMALLGLPPAGILIHQALAAGMTIIEHANAVLPSRIEASARRLVVTPDLHRVHHAADARSFDTNFGTIFSVWDRAFGTYQARDTDLAGMEIGLDSFRERKYLTLPWTLALPFLRERIGASTR
jgi:sterol desaturase/sphingolipid hydroxylase (fatty acid hydroxylase superfamily)